MELPFVVIAFLVLALLVAVGVMVGVAMPHLRSSDGEDEGRAETVRRHRSRTGR
ncbi:hypothetical protein [Brachybacterium sp. YJGR34]|uniref:hypothetical protein n=1 Tax=Brachybacterium sp. YJGR34 TaxID=2059911 RepID=UPI0013007F9A|nr:hypothetical protein [Brachybacterium sp. YJGR34]